MRSTLPCGHPMSDREMTRALHGATQVWCSFCSRWFDVDEETVGEQGQIQYEEGKGSDEGQPER